MKRIALKLYVTGLTPRSTQAVTNVLRVCEAEFEDNYELTIVDVLEEPGEADRERILATPTLIRELPLPRRRIVGDLSDENALHSGLDVL
jgi:circadian clock protein KaiB